MTNLRNFLKRQYKRFENWLLDHQTPDKVAAVERDIVQNDSKSWLQDNGEFIAPLGFLIVVLSLIIGFFVALEKFNIWPNVTAFWDYTFTSPIKPIQPITEYQPGKTLWDWMELLVVPIFLLVGGYVLNRNRKKEQEELQRTTTQGYLNRMMDLLAKQESYESKSGEPPQLRDIVKNIIQAQTRTVLPKLDGKSRGEVLLFLSLSTLINVDKPVINLNNADLSKAELNGADLSKAYLVGVDLREAVLSSARLTDAQLLSAKLNKANLRNATLNKAALTSAELTGADLTGIDFTDAVLVDANLSRTNLSGARLVRAKLIGANLSGAKLNEANLEDADLTEADLNGTDLSNTKLIGINLGVAKNLDHAHFKQKH